MLWLHGRGAVTEHVLSALSWWTSRGKWEAACLHKRVLSHADMNSSKQKQQGQVPLEGVGLCFGAPGLCSQISKRRLHICL